MMTLPYSICFCYRGDLVLMLHRSRPPNQGLWNGLGGKIKAGETPLASVRREVLEEAEIDLAQSPSCRFAGIVTWELWGDTTGPSTGMYVFLAELPPALSVWDGMRITEEGKLCWLHIDGICDPTADDVADNIPHFLPEMLSQPTPHEYEYFCDYRDDTCYQVVVHPLPESLKVDG